MRSSSLEETIEEVLDRRERRKILDEAYNKRLAEHDAIYSAEDHLTAAAACLASEVTYGNGALHYSQKGLAHAILALIEELRKRPGID
jgi:hypothetical protein